MRKTTVYLDEAELAQLKAMAAREGAKPAALIRKAISFLIYAEVEPLPRGTGRYHSGSSDGAASKQVILREATRKGRW